MYRLEREEFVKVPYLSLWATLGFQAGFINAFGFLAVGRYVSHVTGYGTQVGTQAAVKDFLFALELFGSPLFFIAGSFFSGFFTAARLENGERPRFDIPMACFSILLGALFVCGESGLIGEFGTKSRTVELVVLYLLSFVCGLQNGCFSVLTKGQIRTTHMTGISTDIGTDLSRIVFGNLGSEEKRLTNGVNPPGGYA